MGAIRHIRTAWVGHPTVEGAGVHLRRAFGFGQETLFDPFLLLDDFRADDPSSYRAGFPWHPHRGIETITYVLAGEVDHADSLGNSGTIGPGDVQWMTAGSGIIHQEMPRGDADGRMGGFQLWANLPASHKMMAPRYQGVDAAAIPLMEQAAGTVRVVCGRVDEVIGPVTDLMIDPEYLDVALVPHADWTYAAPEGRTYFAYLFEGEARFGTGGDPTPAGPGTVLLFEDGDLVAVRAGAGGARFLLVGGRPLREPVAWRGPIVMNTREELDAAWRELQNGTFVKSLGAGQG
jgi:hypothetical protein